MVNTKLHIICGNCGSTDIIYDKEGHYIGCKDCFKVGRRRTLTRKNRWKRQKE